MNPNQNPQEPAVNNQPATPTYTPQVITPTNPQAVSPVNPTVVSPVSSPEIPQNSFSSPQPPAPLPTPQQPQQTIPSSQNPTGVIYGNNTPNNLTSQPPGAGGPSRKKRLMITGGIALGIVILTAAAVFGFYIPNQPDNVFKTGVSRTGTAIDKLVVEGTEAEKLEAFKNTEISGSIEVDAPEAQFRGSFSSKYDDKQSDSSLSYKNDTPGQEQQKLDVQLLTDIADEQEFPSLYLKISGLASLGLDELSPELAKYDGKWLGASSSYIKSLVPAGEKPAEDNNDFSHKDAVELARTVSSASREYLFSSDPEKAVMVNKEFKGTEKLEDGLSANHYTVGINKENAKKYCKALVERVMGTEAYKKLPGINVDDVAKDRGEAMKSCDEGVDRDFKEDDTFDMWIDKKRKLIHKIRLTDEDDPGTYMEVGQNFTQGDTIPLFLKYHSDEDKYDMTLTLDVDVEKSITKGTFDFQGGDTEKYGAKASFEFKPHEGDVTVEPPQDAIPVEEVLKALGVDPAELGSLYTSEPSDVEDPEPLTD